MICGSIKERETQDLVSVVHEANRSDIGLIFVDLDNDDELMFWKQHSSQNLRVLGEVLDLKGPDKTPVILKQPTQPTAYVCVNFTCKAPTSNPETLKMQMTASQAPVKTELDIGTLFKDK